MVKWLMKIYQVPQGWVECRLKVSKRQAKEAPGDGQRAAKVLAGRGCLRTPQLGGLTSLFDSREGKQLEGEASNSRVRGPRRLRRRKRPRTEGQTRREGLVGWHNGCQHRDRLKRRSA